MLRYTARIWRYDSNCKTNLKGVIVMLRYRARICRIIYGTKPQNQRERNVFPVLLPILTLVVAANH